MPAVHQLSPLLTGAMALALAMSPVAGAQEGVRETTYVAVVVGITSYANLPDAVELDFARSDAATVGAALKDLGHYDHVYLLTDAEATREEIRETLRTRVAQLTGPSDQLLVYFVGHGIGADLGVPVLLAHDSTLQSGHEDGFEVNAFAQDIATWTRAGSTVIVTDAIHKNQLDGIYFYGPSADQWPNVGPRTMVISSSSVAEPAGDGMFGITFADAVAGSADTDKDEKITAGELRDYLIERLEGSGQTPAFGGTFRDDFVIAEGVTPGLTATGGATGVELDFNIYSAKFAFRDVASATIACREAPIKSCEPYCYVRDFRAGPCTMTAVVDGEEVRGVMQVIVPGLYDCGLRADRTLTCVPPKMPRAE